ncbi:MULTISPECIES: hypothetical protein [Butyrivibrio]|nr:MULTISPECIES: hypothetical protein [Butyrivibrio]
MAKQNIYRLLCDGGIFIFSQEHPLTTCYSGTGDRSEVYSY